jgi:hypothetical protein
MMTPREPHEIHCKYCLKRRNLDYMLTNEAWAATGHHPNELVCVPCIERKAGVHLTFEQLASYPVNLMLVHSRFPERRHDFVDAVLAWQRTGKAMPFPHTDLTLDAQAAGR